MNYGCDRGNFEKIFRLSSPSSFISGAPIGDARTADCARTHREQAPRIANFFQSASPPDVAPVPGGARARRSRKASR